MLALEMSGIVLSILENSYEKVKKTTVQIEARLSDLTLNTAFVVVLLRLCGVTGRLCKKFQ